VVKRNEAREGYLIRNWWQQPAVLLVRSFSGAELTGSVKEELLEFSGRSELIPPVSILDLCGCHLFNFKNCSAMEPKYLVCHQYLFF